MRINQLVITTVLLLVFVAGCADSTERTVATSTDVSDSVATTVDAGLADQKAGSRAAADSGIEIPEKLEIGDIAPKIHFTEWVTGEAISDFEPGKVHVVEFWATWCPPCRDSMPHLSSLQDMYGSDVKFMGFSDEPMATVEKFLAKPSQADKDKTWGEVVTYSLVLDEDRLTHQSYMAATGQSGIPAAYIVGREGHLLWKGHPMQMDGPLKSIVAGEWNAGNAAEKNAAAESAVAELRAKQKQFMVAARSEDWDGAIVAFDELLAIPEFAAMVGADAMIQRYQLLSMAGRADEAQQTALDAKTQLWDNPQSLNGLAWIIADLPAENEARDLDLALEAINRANELSGGEEAAVLDTLARVYHEMGDLNAAIDWQEKALEYSDGDEAIEKRLKEYLAERDQAEDETAEDVDTDESSDADGAEATDAEVGEEEAEEIDAE